MHLLEREREWQRQRDETDKKWRETQTELADRRHNESLAVNIRITLIAALIGFAAALAAVGLTYLLK